MSKRPFRILAMLCMAIGLILALGTPVSAEELTPNYQISGTPGAYTVVREGITIGSYGTLVQALQACDSNWGSQPDRPVIQLGSSSSPLSVNRGDGALISATYTGAVKIEYSGSHTWGLHVPGDIRVGLRNFTMTNSVNPGDTLYYSGIHVEYGAQLVIGDGTNISVAAGTGAASGDSVVCAVENLGTTTIRGTVNLSIVDGTWVIRNGGTGECTIGGNEGDDSGSPLRHQKGPAYGTTIDCTYVMELRLRLSWG